MTTESGKTLPLLSLRNLVLFPGAVMPVEIGRASSLKLIESLSGKGAHLLVGTQKDADVEEPSGADLYGVCVEGEVVRVVKAAESRVTAVLRGIERRRHHRLRAGEAVPDRPPTSRWWRSARTRSRSTAWAWRSTTSPSS